ncbi:MAG: metallophosphoesterase [Candidatus Anstonellales archaeon]
MQVLIFTDLHDNLDQIIDKISNFDGFVGFLGDLSNRQDIRLVEKIYDMIDYYIPGNIDGPIILDLMESKNFHYRLIRFQNFDIFGFGFSNPTPFDTYGELSENEIHKKLSKIKLRRDTLLLTHMPPYGILDTVNGKNVGSKSLLEFIQKNRQYIRAHLFGHIHEVVGREGIHYNLKPAFLGGYAIIDDNLNIRMY